jgi:CheY-like chemotaxis protein
MVSSLGQMQHTQLNLQNVTSLVVDSDRFSRGIISQILRSFRMFPSALADNGAQAKAYLESNSADLCIIEAMLPDMESTELISWIRKQDGPIRFVPIIVLTGYTQLKMVSRARDAGANTVLKKPVSPRVLFDRILWLSKADRPFMETNEYVGPDRRFKRIGPPDGDFKREVEGDRNIDLGIANDGGAKGLRTQPVSKLLGAK